MSENEAPQARPQPAADEIVTLGFTAEGMIAVGMLAAFALAAWLLGDNLVLLLFSLLLGAAFVGRRLAVRNVRGLTLTRALPARTRVKQLTPLAYRLALAPGDGTRRARRTSAIGIELEDRLGAGVKPMLLQVELPLVETGKPARIRTHVRFGRRGDHTFKTLVLKSGYPLGLVSARRRLTAPVDILVQPAEGRVTEKMRQRLRGRVVHAVRPTRAWRGDDVLYGVREYRDGDDPRRIHWRTTARRGELTVSEWRAEEGTEVFLVLGRPRGAGARALLRFERAVSCIATLWRAALVDDLRARLVLDASDAPLEAESRHALQAGLDALARVKIQGRRRPEKAVRRIGRVRGRRTIIYVATGPEPELERAVRQAAGRGGDAVIVRCDLKSVRTWVRGIG